MQLRATACLDLVALAHNFSCVQSLAPQSQIMAMVKANAYGHGLLPIAQNLPRVRYFGVACIEEAIALRSAGMKQDIVLMSGFHAEEELNVLLEYHIQPVIYDWQQIYLLKKLPAYRHLTVWLKIDTGMHRLGFAVTEALRAWQALKSCVVVDNIIVMTHFACANEEHNFMMEKQYMRFMEATSALNSMRSAANSAAIIQYPKTQFDIVRPGLMLYGVSPCNNSSRLPSLLPVMTLRSKVITLHTVDSGESVGYGATWVAKERSRIATVSIGYGDGYPQNAPNGTPVLIKGKIASIVGRVSMDTLTIDVSHIPEVIVGDEVILWGNALPIEEIAKFLNASVYALLTGISARVRRSLITAPV